MKMILGALSNKSLLLERWTRGVFAVHRQSRARVNCFVLFGALTIFCSARMLMSPTCHTAATLRVRIAEFLVESCFVRRDAVVFRHRTLS